MVLPGVSPRPRAGGGKSGPPLLCWHDIADGTAAAVIGQTVQLEGWLTAPDFAGGRMMVAEPPCCPGCLPGSDAARVRVPDARQCGGGAALLAGTLHREHGAWTLDGARPSSRHRRRTLLGSAPLLCLAAAAPEPDPRAVLAGTTAVDVHSHAGRLLYVRSGGPFTPVAEPMRQGGLAVVCLAIVSDGPTHRVMADHRIHPFRDPASAELYAYARQSFTRLMTWSVSNR